MDTSQLQTVNNNEIKLSGAPHCSEKQQVKDMATVTSYSGILLEKQPHSLYS